MMISYDLKPLCLAMLLSFDVNFFCETLKIGDARMLTMPSARIAAAARLEAAAHGPESSPCVCALDNLRVCR